MISGIMRRHKKYVEVAVEFGTDGRMTPTAIRWDDGRMFEITRVLESRRAASLKVGGTGMRYLCEIGTTRTFLYFEDPAWFVEEKEVE